ncbi:unnamed protein product, partial [marine sediment metagenome]
MEREDYKKQAGEEAVKHIEDGMILGLGTGSTVEYTLRKLGQMVKEGLKIEGIPTSVHTKRIAKEENIPLTTLEEHPDIDVTIDGADEVDSYLNLIKGGGGALTREKIIAFNSKKVIIVVDDSKVVKALGIDFPLAVEVIKFGLMMDGKGWVDIEELIHSVGTGRSGFNWLRRRHIEALAKTDPRGRYQIDGGMIRATYGHTIDVTLDDLPEAELD